MKSLQIVSVAAAMLFSTRVLAQTPCSSDCYSDVSMTSCQASQFACLCKDETYIDYVNTCIMTNCNTTDDKLAAYATTAEICSIFGVTLDGPEASAVAVESTSSISGIGSLQSSLSAFSTGMLGPPTIGPVSTTSTTRFPTPINTFTSRVSSIVSANPGGPIGIAPSGTTTPSAMTSANPGGPIMSATTATVASTTTSPTPASASTSTEVVSGTVGTTSGALTTSAAASSSASVASGNAGARPTVIPGYEAALLGLGFLAVAAL